jgi:opacity protein-like surface antigen
MPSIYWSNIVKNQWMAHNKARAEVAMGEWTSTLLSGSPEFTFQQNKLESISPEELLLEKKYKTSIGGAFYVGVSKLSANRFCYGFEVKAVLKGISVNRKESNKELLNADDTFLVYQKHQLLGKVTYSMNVEYYKNLELSACVRLGYFSTNRIMPYIKFGGSANRNEYRELRIDTASDLSVQRFDDSVYAEYLSTTYLKDIKPSNYTVPKKKQWYAAINVGPGVDYFVSRKFFTRFEYEFKMAFSSRSSTLSNVNADEDIYKAYGLRYQDIEHCISIGFGVYL